MKSLFFVYLAATAAMAADPAGIAFFEQKIRPVFVEHCYSCHSADAKKLKGNLYLDSTEGWQKGGDSNKAVIVPGKPDESLLIRSIRHLEPDLEMPPKKPKLSDAIIADLVAWVKMGAPDPREGKVEAKRGDKSWWSLQPLGNDEGGRTKDESRSRIDQFVAEKMAEKRLTMNAPADPRALIRRMTYDLHGLPPTAEEVESFVAQCSRNRELAVRALVDRLLASPRYGEQWGRHWLDVVRFGESNGFERNFVIDDLYPFRDYVIKSINDDKPFNQFITEHLAGDVIGKDKPEIEVGSAFLVAGPYDDVGNQDPVAQKNIRAATLDDIITATGSAFLGLTVNCARCHNHKFDPIPTEDYYRLRSAFEGITHGRRVIASTTQRDAFTAATKPLQAEIKKLSDDKAALDDNIEVRAKVAMASHHPTRPKIDVQGTDETFAATEARYVKFVIHALTSDYQPSPTKAKRTPSISSGAGRLTEFQIWSAEAEPRNEALASNGSKAEGAKSATAEDFPEAYGPQLCIDGVFGEQWFIGSPAELLITLPKTESINRITFINAKGGRDIDESKVRGATPCEYEVQVSLDGKAWRTVASDEGREPWSPAHAMERARREVITKEEKQQLASLDQQIAAAQRKLSAVPALPMVWAGNYTAHPAETFVHKGGDPMKPGDAVVPASLSVLDQVTKPYALKADAPESERRLALARWITSDDNALTARVLANRVWQHHFGTGIVDTPSDFGFLGSRPTHPELLDYLAGRLIANGWKLKALHREILLSQAYQQSAAYREEAAKEDKDARLLWRFPPRRLTAEEIRDTMLAVAGKLKLEPMGGPGFRLYKFTQNNVCTYFPLDQLGPETYRRAVYHQNARASVVDVLNDFDLPDIAFAAPKRANTTTPLQALTLLNHSFTLDMASAIAERSSAQPGHTEESIKTAYRLVLQRQPTSEELKGASVLVQKFGMPAFCRALLNANELLYLE
jgi:mono/diheme cytochrome c family protein